MSKQSEKEKKTYKKGKRMYAKIIFKWNPILKDILLKKNNRGVSNVSFDGVEILHEVYVTVSMRRFIEKLGYTIENSSRMTYNGRAIVYGVHVKTTRQYNGSEIKYITLQTWSKSYQDARNKLDKIALGVYEDTGILPENRDTYHRMEDCI